MKSLTGTPRQALFGATLGFFVGFAAVALFGPTASRFKEVMNLSPTQVALLVAIPALTGSLLRIPFSAWVDTTGGRKPLLVLLGLSLAGMSGLFAVTHLFYPDHLGIEMYPLILILGALCGCGIAIFSVGISQVSYWYPQKGQGRALAVYAGIGNLAPGIFSFILPMVLVGLGLSASYLVWLLLLATGFVLYWFTGRNAWYFQYREANIEPQQAQHLAREQGQELFPAGSVVEGLKIAARRWHTWILVIVYFTTFGGFVALTAWLPTYWEEFFSLSPVKAGILTGIYSILTSVVRIVGGVLSDGLRRGGENTAILSLLVALFGAMLITSTDQFQIAVPAIIIMAVGMGVCNAAVFKLVPQVVPEAVGGAAGWVGGLGAFGGFIIPPIMGYAVEQHQQSGYPLGFMTFIGLLLFSLILTWILKYSPDGDPDTA